VRALFLMRHYTFFKDSNASVSTISLTLPEDILLQIRMMMCDTNIFLQKVQ